MNQTLKTARTSFLVIFGGHMPISEPLDFFQSTASLLQIVYSGLIDAKNQKNLIMGSMRTFVTDIQTD